MNFSLVRDDSWNRGWDICKLIFFFVILDNLQNASKFGKLSSGHRTGKCQYSFQYQRKAMPNNVKTITQLHSSHMIAKSCSKLSKIDFNSMWTEKFQMFKLDLEKAEEPEIKLSTSAGSLLKRESSRKTSTSALLTTPKPLTV